MQTVLVTAQRPAAVPCSRQAIQGVRCQAPSRSAVSHHSRRQQAAQPHRQLAQQAANSSWRRQRAVAAQAAPRHFDKDHFQSANEEFAVLTQQIKDTAAEVMEGLQGTSLFLVGMMGSGKSTVGKLISQALGYCFFDTDQLIEQLSQQKVAEIFVEDGEESFRELETQVLAELAAFKNCVVATGGGVPTRAENWGHMQGGVSVWLNGPPTLLAHRVVSDGAESRPLLSQGEAAAGGRGGGAYQAAVGRLSALLEERRALYEMADLAVSLEGSGPDADVGAPAMEVTHRVLAAINQRIKVDMEERRRRIDFEIVKDGKLPATMRFMDSPASKQAQEDPFLP